jgi:hypothetical protein
MNGIDFIWPDLSLCEHPEFDKITLALVAPQPYLTNNSLSEHMHKAIRHDVHYLSALHHVNEKSGKEFDCFSYYADDPDVIAFSAAHENVFLVTVGISFVRRLAKICSRMAPMVRVQHERLQLWYQHRGGEEPQSIQALKRDEVLSKLLEGNSAVTEAEAQEIVALWPPASTDHGQLELGEYVLFYDMIRLVWLHEWAHALCGHVTFAANELHLSQFDEFSKQRLNKKDLVELKYPRNDVLQSLETHADEFAVQYCVRQILWGYDPIGEIAGPDIDLIERLLLFNAACSVFAVVWSLGEQRFSPGMTFYPPRQDLDSKEPDPMFATFKATHPPAALRYLRFRDFQSDVTREYAQQKALPMLLAAVDTNAFWFVTTAARLDEHFYDLRAVTPVVVNTPTTKRLDAYQAYLLKIASDIIEPRLVELAFLPTVDPYDEPGQ